MTANSSRDADVPGIEHQELLSGFVRLHVLHHAVRDGVYGRWMIGELARHGYRVSAGTLYPMLHQMERRGYLISEDVPLGRTRRRVYRATDLGRAALAMATSKLSELFREIVEDQ